MRLRVARILGTPDRKQRRLCKCIGDQRHRIGNRKRVAVQEHQQILVRGDVGDLDRQVIELVGVTTALLDHVIEVSRV